jgi:hypothetical protein
MIGQTEVVRCRYVTGLLDEVTLHDLAEFRSPGSALEQRLVRVNGRTYVRKFVSRKEGNRNPRLYGLLDNEIRAGTRLGQVFPDRFPAEVANLVAYNVDVEEPFVLLREYAGEPVANLVSRFGDAERRQFEHGLFRALQLTAVAGVVHGAVTMASVRWNNGRLQLVDFESAERVGEPRRDGNGSVDARDDMWAAALLVRSLHLGSAQDGILMDRDHDPERLRALLDPVFDRPVEQRPYPADLLSRLRAENHLPAFVDPDAKLTAGRELFERVSQGKREPAETGTVPDQGPRPARRAKGVLLLVALLVVIAIVIAGVVVLG